ncbi:7-deoxyloganetic acid glucosyltransferase-like [Sesamum indicum]|uniref:Glycosyltransferase n=1 Tax=Sesamum indicum TaxID=4182 RepID=A0A6I9TNR1_SESIN|nr:7-deoxyloganetic acid glucosyltransferase-like [Sesamum indicum]
MSRQESTAVSPPHVLIFPVPLQGHVNSMLNLAELLCLSGLHVTILLSDYTHNRLLRHASLQSRFSRHSGFRVVTISDGLPADHPRVGERIVDIVLSLKEVGGQQFRHLMESTDGLSDGGARRRVSCLIVDGVFRFAIPVVEEMGIPYIYFRTISACSFWPYFCLQEIIDAGEVPLKGKNEDKLTYWKKKEMDLMVTSVPGMERVLRRRDIPRFCQVEDINHPGLQTMKTETRRTIDASGLILNTFEDLEGPILDEIRKHIPNLYSIGPLHALLKAGLESEGMESSRNRSSSFWEEDQNCIAWLDSQPASSVIYVSFGSVTILTRDELLEFWYGLVNSGHRFLWVIRPDSIIGNDNGNGNEIPVELEEGTKSRGYMVGWVPQQQVLAHPAIGAFFTHSGWNSTLESITLGLPMLCWAYFADQITNSRFVSEVWKVGLDMKDTCDRIIVEKMVKEVMEVRREEFLERADSMATLARKAISEGGSSYLNLNGLIEFLKSTVS